MRGNEPRPLGGGYKELEQEELRSVDLESFSNGNRVEYCNGIFFFSFDIIA